MQANFDGVKNASSRGDLPVHFLTSDQSPHEYAEATDLQARAEAVGLLRSHCSFVTTIAQLICKTHRQAYNGFNLVVGDLASGEVAYVSNRGGQTPTLLQPGVHGISNGQLQSRWPKVCRVRARTIFYRDIHD